MTDQTPIALTLAFADVKLIAAALHELPYRVAAPVLQRLEQQVNAAPVPPEASAAVAKE